jgi:hypothetical protein
VSGRVEQPRSILVHNLAIDRPVDKANQAGAADDIAERYRDQIMDDPRDRDHRSIETCRDLAGLGQQPSQRQKIHVGDAVFEAGRDERGDRQNQTDDLVSDRATRIGKPDPQANETLHKMPLKNSVTMSGLIFAAAVFNIDRPMRPPLKSG